MILHGDCGVAIAALRAEVEQTKKERDDLATQLREAYGSQVVKERDELREALRQHHKTVHTATDRCPVCGRALTTQEGQIRIPPGFDAESETLVDPTQEDRPDEG